MWEKQSNSLSPHIPSVFVSCDSYVTNAEQRETVRYWIILLCVGATIAYQSWIWIANLITPYMSGLLSISALLAIHRVLQILFIVKVVALFSGRLILVSLYNSSEHVHDLNQTHQGYQHEWLKLRKSNDWVFRWYSRAILLLTVLAAIFFTLIGVVPVNVMEMSHYVVVLNMALAMGILESILLGKRYRMHRLVEHSFRTLQKINRLNGGIQSKSDMIERWYGYRHWKVLLSLNLLCILGSFISALVFFIQHLRYPYIEYREPIAIAEYQMIQFLIFLVFFHVCDIYVAPHRASCSCSSHKN